jgi:hypothetical protein
VPSSDTLKTCGAGPSAWWTQRIEVIFYSPDDEKWKATDTVPEFKVIPVVFVDGKLLWHRAQRVRRRRGQVQASEQQVLSSNEGRARRSSMLE